VTSFPGSEKETFRDSLSDESTSAFWQPLPERNPTSALQSLDRVKNDGAAKRISRFTTYQERKKLVLQ
jgi:hypothetical protein